MKGEINMTKWTNNDGEIFENEDAARDRCYDMIDEDDIIEVIKDDYIESFWQLFMDALSVHDFWNYEQLKEDIFDKVWEDCGFTEIEVEDDEDGK